MVKVLYIGQAALVGPAQTYWYPGETLEINAKLLNNLRAQHGDVFVVQGEPGGEAAPQPLEFGTAGAPGDGAMAAGKRKK